MTARPAERGALPDSDVSLNLDMTGLDTLMPMHLLLGADGRIRHAGPTFAKIVGGRAETGADPFDLLTIPDPYPAASVSELRATAGARLKLVVTGAQHRPLRAVAAALPDGGVLLDVSPGLSFVATIRDCNLTLNDFSPCDQTGELMVLHQVNSATAEESRKLTERLHRQKSEAEQEALTDTLTGLSNRRALDVQLRHLVESDDRRFAVMHLDLDYFKAVNDTHGHAAGDHILTRAGEILRGEVRDGDIVARVGGDEFVIVLIGLNDGARVHQIARRIIAQLETPILFEGKACRISASAGSTLASRYRRPSIDALLGDADAALYASKRAGRGRHSLFGPTTLE